jgi:ATP-binding cassette subfamily B protein RaxB
MVLRWHGTDVTLQELRERFPISVRGTTVADLVAMGSALGMAPRAVKAELGQLRELATPCVLHWDMNHYVVLESADHQYARIVDPSSGPWRVPMAEVSKHFTGIALELRAPASWEPPETPRRFGFGALLSPLKAIRGVLLAVFLAACLVEGAALVAPLYLQTVIDSAVRIGDSGVLPVLALGFGAVVLVHGLLTGLGLRFTEHWLARAYATLLTLPMAFYQAVGRGHRVDPGRGDGARHHRHPLRLRRPSRAGLRRRVRAVRARAAPGGAAASPRTGKPGCSASSPATRARGC